MPNVTLQDRRLSYTARGLLGDLLSRPDGWREDGRSLADSCVQGRIAVAKALRELTAAGYYWVVKYQDQSGKWHSAVHVYDTPQQLAPGVETPGSGRRNSGGPGGPLKDLDKEPSLPVPPLEPEPAGTEPAGTEPAGTAPPAEAVPAERRRTRAPRAVEPPDDRTDEAVSVLFRVIRPEPRLRLGQAEARRLAPLVAGWLERGSSPADLAQALLSCLPATIHSAFGVLRHRLTRKMPPVPEAAPPVVARYAECGQCHDPVPRPGICRPCAGLGTRPVAVGTGEAATRRGAALVRAAMRSAGDAAAAAGWDVPPQVMDAPRVPLT
ncbi:hypothetical protein [Streptomyces sp. NRRL B-24484]|uniref:hypothetical protein n=1 Tax=Streptomyces sp. NRRL B-24484 TaxID=1463833 RepID=UPI0004C015DC|nr:hypothetical protein [Streptomyces sp. NRRL B-24484]